jgi:hypothetical protein
VIINVWPGGVAPPDLPASPTAVQEVFCVSDSVWWNPSGVYIDYDKDNGRSQSQGARQQQGEIPTGH